MQIEKTFPAHSLATHARPWLAVVTSWPDNSPPACTFGKTVRGATPATVRVEAQAGDVVRWGAKLLATGTSDPALAGWAIVCANGTLQDVDKDHAQAARRRAHPEDAKAAAVVLKHKGRPYARQHAAAAVAPTSTRMPLADAPVHVLAEALLRAAGHPNPGADKMQSLIDFAHALAGPASTPAAPAPAPAPAPVLPVYVPPAQTPVDADGVPLF